jgi:hypothetical protein
LISGASMITGTSEMRKQSQLGSKCIEPPVPDTCMRQVDAD